MGNNVMKVLIVDDNVDLVRLLSEYLNQIEDMQVVGTAKDGLEAIEAIQRLQPDVVILDIIMPGLDGIGVLERFNSMQMEHKPSFVILSAIGKDSIIQNAIALGAEYYMVKPLDVDILISRLRQVHKSRSMSVFLENKEAESLRNQPAVQGSETDVKREAFISAMVKEYGIPPHIIGYQYVKEAILEFLKNPKGKNGVTKVIYPAVAHKFQTTPQRVEKAIRNAIRIAWEKHKGTSKVLLHGFKKGKPTNSEFIAALAEKIRMGE